MYLPVLISLLAILLPFVEGFCKGLDRQIEECASNATYFFSELEFAGIELASEEGIAELCNPNVTYDLDCLFWFMKLCPDLDVKKFIPIFDMVKIDGFDLNMAIDDGGLASNCELLGPCDEVMQCYRIVNNDLDYITSTDSDKNNYPVLSDGEKDTVNEGTENKLTSTSTYWNTLFRKTDENSSTIWWFKTSTSLPRSTIDDRSSTKSDKNDTTDLPLSIVSGDNNAADGENAERKAGDNMPGGGDSLPSDETNMSMKENNLRMGGHIMSIGGNMPVRDDLRSIYLTTPLSFVNIEQRSQFLSLTVTMCGQQHKEMRCGIYIVKKCSKHPPAGIEQEFFKLVNIAGPPTTQDKFIVSDCSSSVHQNNNEGGTDTCIKGTFVPLTSSACMNPNINNSDIMCNINEFGKIFVWEYVEPNCGSKIASFLLKKMCLVFPKLPDKCNNTDISGTDFIEAALNISGKDFKKHPLGIVILSYILLFYLSY